MLKIYGADLSTPANKVRMVANYLGLKYDYIKISIRDGENRTEQYLKLHPFGKVPVIDDDGFALFESGAICKYLCTKAKSAIYPAELKARAIVDQWIDFVTLHIGAAMGRVVFNRLFAGLANVPVDENSLKDGLNFLKKFLPGVDAQLAKNKYVAGGSLTLADITLLAVLDPAELAGVELGPYKAITSWREKLIKEDFYLKCHQRYGEALRKLAAK